MTTSVMNVPLLAKQELRFEEQGSGINVVTLRGGASFNGNLNLVLPSGVVSNNQVLSVVDVTNSGPNYSGNLTLTTLNINGIANINITSAADNQILQYNVTQGNWENRSRETLVANAVNNEPMLLVQSNNDTASANTLIELTNAGGATMNLFIAGNASTSDASIQTPSNLNIVATGIVRENSATITRNASTLIQDNTANLQGYSTGPMNLWADGALQLQGTTSAALQTNGALSITSNAGAVTVTGLNVNVNSNLLVLRANQASGTILSNVENTLVSNLAKNDLTFPASNFRVILGAGQSSFESSYKGTLNSNAGTTAKAVLQLMPNANGTFFVHIEGTGLSDPPNVNAANFSTSLLPIDIIRAVNFSTAGPNTMTEVGIQDIVAHSDWTTNTNLNTGTGFTDGYQLRLLESASVNKDFSLRAKVWTVNSGLSEVSLSWLI